MRNRPVKVKGVRNMHEVSNIFTQEKTISSLEVAEMVEKEHKNLMRDVRNYVAELNQLKIEPVDFFQESKYKDGKGEERPCYNITKKGCEFIAHKLTGIKGTKFTALYINRFHDMEEQLKPKSSAEMLLIYAQQFYEQEQRLQSVEHNIKQIEAKITTHDENYYTIAGYASLRGIRVDVNRANMYGRKASKLSKEYGYDVTKTQDPRFGTVNMYHADILKDIFG
nr:MAG TPA: regulatory protein [Caudoviricetes sp.]